MIYFTTVLKLIGPSVSNKTVTQKKHLFEKVRKILECVNITQGRKL